MPVREYCEGRLVDLGWDLLDALGGAVGAVAGGILGNMVDGLPAIGGLGALGGGVGVGLSTVRSADLLFFDDFKAYPDGSSGAPNWAVMSGVWKTYRGYMWAFNRLNMTYWGALVAAAKFADGKAQCILSIDKLYAWSDVGLIVRYASDLDFLVLRLIWTDRKYVQFAGRSAGKEVYYVAKPYEFEEKKAYTLEADCRGNLFVGYVNGAEVLRFTSDKVPASGAVGLHDTYLDVAFSKVKVYP